MEDITHKLDVKFVYNGVSYRVGEEVKFHVTNYYCADKPVYHYTGKIALRRYQDGEGEPHFGFIVEYTNRLGDQRYAPFPEVIGEFYGEKLEGE